MAKATAEEGPSYGAMERFLIWFLIPFVFTAVLLGVLLTIFDYDIMNSALRVANKIPIVKSIVPEPKTKTDQNQPVDSAAAGKTADSAQTGAQTEEQSSKVTELQNEVKKAEAKIEQKDQTIKELQSKTSAQADQDKAKADEEYAAKIQQLATTYAKMSPSKSAPILENLTLSEQALILGQMKTDDRVKVLEKMDPKKAAEASILLKDQTSARDAQIAALQDRLQQKTATGTTTAGTDNKLSKTDLGSTFANMTPKSAATVLLELQKNNPDKVITILNSMDNTGRSKIMSALSDASKETAALISSRLAQ